MRPKEIHLITDIATLNIEWAEGLDPSRFPEAERWWKKAVAHDPINWEIHDRYALMLESYAKAKSEDVAIRRRSIEELEKVARIKSSGSQDP